MQRINVVGTTGSGKSTLARRLAQILDVPFVELDSIDWQPGWTMTPREIADPELRRRTAAPRWVLDGNIGLSRAAEAETLQLIDTMVWLDYSLPLILSRHLKRAYQRIVLREPCCNGNYESLARTLSRDSIIGYALKTYRKRRVQYLGMMRDPQWQHLQWIHLRSPRQAEQWLRKVAQSKAMRSNPADGF